MVDLSDLTSTQWGLLTSAQARVVGVSAQQLKRFADEGLVDRLRHGVYRIAGAPSPSHEQLRAAWLAIEPAVPAHLRDLRAVVSYRSAARLFGLGDLDADVMEFTVDRRKQSRLLDIRYHRGTVDASDVTLSDGLPVTTVTRTIADLAADQLDGSHLAGVVRDAIRTGLVDVDSAAEALTPHTHKYGAPRSDGDALLWSLLSDAGLSPGSAAVLHARLGATSRKRKLVPARAARIGQPQRRIRG